MRTIGLPISLKENEKRRILIPEDIKEMKYADYLYFESSYGEVLGISDKEYEAAGSHVVSRETVLSQDIICDPKVGDAEYLSNLQNGQTIFGWIHATQNRDITDKIVNNGLTAYAWENMYYKGKHIFYRNNELAGEAAVMHAFLCYGQMPGKTNVAVIGRGNTARGAIKVLNQLGAEVTQYSRYTEELLREEINKYDVIVNCVLWDVSRDDHIVYKEDLSKMKNGSMIIDVSCDYHGGIETSEPTTIETPIYVVDGVLHYVVDHTPSLVFRNFSFETSKIIGPFLEELIEDSTTQVLNDALIIENGNVIDEEIKIYQKR